MGCQMIKQHNGKYAVFSTNSDKLLLVDASREQVLAWWHLYYLEKLAEDMEDITKKFDKVESGDRIYYQFTKSWRTALAEENFRVWAEGEGTDDEYDQRREKVSDVEGAEEDLTPKELKQFEGIRDSEEHTELRQHLDEHLKNTEVG